LLEKGKNMIFNVGSMVVLKCDKEKNDNSFLTVYIITESQKNSWFVCYRLGGQPKSRSMAIPINYLIAKGSEISIATESEIKYYKLRKMFIK
jgi:hypothetical protein